MSWTRVLVSGALLGALLGISALEGQSREKNNPRDSATDHRRHATRDNRTTELFRLLGRNAVWTPVSTIKANWNTFHTQGLVKIGDAFYVSSVEVVSSTVRNSTTTDALYDFSIDRSEGSGRGWLFKFDATGTLLGQVELTSGAQYHPGGIDYDGRWIWVAVAEYRPNSRSHVYRIDPDTMIAELVFSVNDHIGGIVHNVHDDTLRGVSWGSRRLYTWKLRNANGAPTVVSSGWVPNPSWYVDYQDCHYQGVEYMLCGGVASYGSPRGSAAFGGLDLIDLRSSRPDHQIPVNLFIDEGTGANPGLSLSHNAFWLEPQGKDRLRGYFMTESNNQADLLVYDITPWINR